MKPADPKRDYRDLVREGYDRLAAIFNAARVTEDAPALSPLLDALPAGSRVLDLGCGAGVPVARTLARAHRVLGVDVSEGQLALAREQVPGAEFLRADMSRVEFPAGSFNAVVSFYAIFHLPLEEHAPLIGRIADWLRPGGYLLATVSPQHEEGYTEDFFGEEMYWSNLGLREYLAILGDCGFEVMQRNSVGHGYPDEGAKAERHPLLFARKVG